MVTLAFVTLWISTLTFFQFNIKIISKTISKLLIFSDF
jgi:hypothetical protein